MPSSESLLRAILRITALVRLSEQGSGRESRFVCEYRVARIGEAGETAFPGGAGRRHELETSIQGMPSMNR